MQLLAQRYPQYADKIQGKPHQAPPPSHQAPPTGHQAPPNGQIEKPARARDAQRRRTAVVTYDPTQASNTLEYDDLGTMSDIDLPSFQRGGITRTSLPIVRSASTSLERPLGLVFLVFADQTKKSLLPNEITTLDTVRALFVRAFPDLSLEMLESPRRKIYILDPATSIYFQLEDLAEIKDRSVLKIHETDSDEPQKVKERQEVRGRTVQLTSSRPPSRQGYAEVPVGSGDVFGKTQSLPPSANQAYPEMMQEQRHQWEMERRSRSRTPEDTDRPRSMSTGSRSTQRDRMPTPERGVPLNPIPENRQVPRGYRDHQSGFYDPGYRGPAYPNAIYDVAPGYQVYQGSSGQGQGQAYVARSTRAPAPAHPQRAIAAVPDQALRGSNRHSLAFAPLSPTSTAPEGGFQRAQTYRPAERSGEVARLPSQASDDPHTRTRIEQMEAQLANLTAWVHYQKSESAPREQAPPPRSLSSVKSLAESSDTFPASSTSKPKEENASISTISAPNHVVSQKGLSDYTDSSGSQRRSSASSLPPSTTLSGQSTPRNQAELKSQLSQLKTDLQGIRRQQQLNTEEMREEIMNTFSRIKSVISAKPGADNQVNVQRRVEVTGVKQAYQTDKHQVDKELGDLEFSVEELRNDVISRQCRVNMADVEGMALLLSNLTKQMADLKARFPEIQDQMKQVMDGELRQVVAEEKFLKEEPTKIESSLKRCKKMTETLYTLKRLATVQDHRAPQVPTLPPAPEVPDGDNKMAVLENIRALVPDHEQRVQHMEAADAARERKKKISTQQEGLKFGKTLEMASRNLKPSAGEKVTEEKVQPSQSSTVTTSAGKPALPAKPSARVTFSTSNNTATRTPDSTNTATTATSVIITSTQNTRPSFSASSIKTSEKPTATVSALTSVNTPATNTVSAIASKESVMKSVSSSVTETSTTVCSSSHSSRGKIVTNSQSDPSKKTEPSSPVKLTSPVKPPVFTRPPTLGISGINRSPTRDGSNKLVRKDSDKTGAKISFSDKVQRIPPKELTSPSTPVSSPPSEDQKVINGLDTVKIDLATQKQAARSAFFSSMSPTSPDVKSPNRDSATLDPGPVVRPGPIVTPVIAGATTKTNAGQTINLVLSGTVSPQSPSNPGAFAIYPPKELVSPTAPASSKSPLSSPSKSSSIPVSDKLSSSAPLSPSSLDGEENSSDVVLRNKKVPPPPPPRKTSRPTSASLSPPLNGRASVSEESSPRFVGGVLGHHRLSGGPLSSTPKPTSQNSLGKLDKDITSGLHSKNQKNSIQPVTSDSSKSTTDVKGTGVPCGDAQKCAHTLTSSDYLPPPPPHVTMALDRDERGSSSESTSSSSGQSMGSQQSVINVVASKLANDSPSSGPKSPNSSGGAAKPPNTSTFSSSKSSKPDPPRRHSSLLAKFTGSSRDANTNGSNGKANMNGVDL